MKRGLVFGFLLLASVSFASLHESLPSWHWSYDLIEQLQLRGGFRELSRLNRPYTRGEVAGALIGLRKDMESGAVGLSPTERKQFTLLVREFREEIARIAGKEDGDRSVRFGTRLGQDAFKTTGAEAQTKGIYRFTIGASLTEHAGVYNAMNLDQYKVDDPLYPGKKWRGIVGFTEQSYLTAARGRFRLKFGRDFLRWGAGESGTLFFSDVCRPLDQFLWSFDLGPFRFSSLTSVLDDIVIPSDWEKYRGDGKANRYLSAHRLNVDLLEGRLEVALTEAIVYGGPHRPLDWVYLNPFMIYYGTQLNKKDRVNVAGTIEALFYPVRNWRITGTFFLDDIQVEKTGPGDLEPSTLGWLIGTQWTDPFRLPGMTLSGEFVRVTNRTYKTPNPWESFLFQNEPLGHPLGNDFDHWQIGAEQWFGASVRMGLLYSRTRKGEGSLFTPWEAPWMDYTVEEGYSEPWLSGTVETRQALGLTLRYQPATHWGLDGTFRVMRRKNADHLAGETRDETFWKIGVWVMGDFRIGE